LEEGVVYLRCYDTDPRNKGTRGSSRVPALTDGKISLHELSASGIQAAERNPALAVIALELPVKELAIVNCLVNIPVFCLLIFVLTACPS